MRIPSKNISSGREESYRSYPQLEQDPQLGGSKPTGLTA